MEKNDDDVIIKFEELNKVIPECIDHISGLLKTAKHLHDNNSYEHSIMMNIISYEELNKLAVFCDHQRKFKDVKRKIMIDLTKHKYKLTWIHKSDCEDTSGSNYEHLYDVQQHKKNLELLIKWFPVLNYVKQMAMYYDFRENRSITLKDVIPKDNLALCSQCLFYFVEFEFQRILLIYKFKDSRELVGIPIASDETVEESKEWKTFKTLDVESKKEDFVKLLLFCRYSRSILLNIISSSNP